MSLEIWIVLALVIATAIFAAAARLRRKRRAAEPKAERNVYPLW